MLFYKEALYHKSQVKNKLNTIGITPEVSSKLQKFHLQLALTINIEPTRGPSKGSHMTEIDHKENPVGLYGKLTIFPIDAGPVARQGNMKIPLMNLKMLSE